MIVIDAKIVGAWSVATAGNQDCMVALREIEPENLYEIVYHFRHPSPESKNPFDDKDVKNRYVATFNATRAMAINGCRLLADTLYEAAKIEKPFELLNDDCDHLTFMRLLQERDDA